MTVESFGGGDLAVFALCFGDICTGLEGLLTCAALRIGDAGSFTGGRGCFASAVTLGSLGWDGASSFFSVGTVAEMRLLPAGVAAVGAAVLAITGGRRGADEVLDSDVVGLVRSATTDDTLIGVPTVDILLAAVVVVEGASAALVGFACDSSLTEPTAGFAGADTGGRVGGLLIVEPDVRVAEVEERRLLLVDVLFKVEGRPVVGDAIFFLKASSDAILARSLAEDITLIGRCASKALSRSINVS